jgi:hypothetical protein
LERSLDELDGYLDKLKLWKIPHPPLPLGYKEMQKRIQDSGEKRHDYFRMMQNWNTEMWAMSHLSLPSALLDELNEYIHELKKLIELRQAEMSLLVHDIREMYHDLEYHNPLVLNEHLLEKYAEVFFVNLIKSSIKSFVLSYKNSGTERKEMKWSKYIFLSNEIVDSAIERFVG